MPTQNDCYTAYLGNRMVGQYDYHLVTVSHGWVITPSRRKRDYYSLKDWHNTLLSYYGDELTITFRE